MVWLKGYWSVVLHVGIVIAFLIPLSLKLDEMARCKKDGICSPWRLETCELRQITNIAYAYCSGMATCEGLLYSVSIPADWKMPEYHSCADSNTSTLDLYVDPTTRTVLFPSTFDWFGQREFDVLSWILCIYAAGSRLAFVWSNVRKQNNVVMDSAV